MSASSADKYNLEAVQARVNESREYFLHCLDAYREYDGEQVIKRFLFAFRDRAPATIKTEEEAEHSIRSFNSVCASLTSHVALGQMRLQQTALSIQIHIMGQGIGIMGGPLPKPAGESAIKILQAQMEKIRAAKKAVEDSADWAFNVAAKIGDDLANMQTMAGDLIRLRTLTLQAFKEEHIGTSLHELIEQVHNREYVKTGVVIVDGIRDRVWEAAKELAAFVAEKNPSVELFNLVKRLGKALRGKDINTTGGGTELMNELVSQLRTESDILSDVDKAYQDLMSEFDKATAALQSDPKAV